MKRRAPDTPIRPAVPRELPLDFADEYGDDDEDFDTVDTVELVVTQNGSSSRVICIAIENGEATGISSVPPPPARPTAR